MNYTDLVEILLDQKKIMDNIKDSIERDIDFEKYIGNDEIIAIIGPRRSGKSYLMMQFRQRVKQSAYVNFEDDRLIRFSPEDFDTLIKAIHEVYGKTDAYFFDEIQNVPSWELFIRRLYNEKKKVFITGSSAKLLSSELASSLTGRHIDIHLLPFSFREFVKANGIGLKRFYDLDEKAVILSSFREYMENGGFPQYVKTKNRNILHNIYNDIVYKDIIPRFKIDNEAVFKEILFYLSTNTAKEISYNNIAATLNIKSVNTVKKYISALEAAYLVFLNFHYYESNKRMLKANRKAYFVDNGIRNMLTFPRYLDKGNLLENLVYLELIRRGYQCFFFRNKKECDFVAHRNKERLIVQACFELNEKNEEREIEGILDAMDFFKKDEGLILTFDQEKKITRSGRIIEIKPAWRWMLGEK